MKCPQCKENKMRIDFIYPRCVAHCPQGVCIDCYDTTKCEEDEFNCKMVWLERQLNKKKGDR